MFYTYHQAMKHDHTNIIIIKYLSKNVPQKFWKSYVLYESVVLARTYYLA